MRSRRRFPCGAQYYIWHGDHTGYLLFEALWQAGERGVRVRLLLDDNNTTGLDATIAALDAHPNIEVRLLQPAGASHGALDELCDRPSAPEPPHAQQVAHGRQSGDGRRRAQHRRRVLRRRSRGGVRGPGRDRSGAGCARGVQGLRSVLEQPVQLPRREGRGTGRPWNGGAAQGDLRCDARRPGIGAVSRVAARDAPRDRAERGPACPRVDRCAPGVRRSGEDPRHREPHR